MLNRICHVVGCHFFFITVCKSLLFEKTLFTHTRALNTTHVDDVMLMHTLIVYLHLYDYRRRR